MRKILLAAALGATAAAVAMPAAAQEYGALHRPARRGADRLRQPQGRQRGRERLDATA
ncbi:hypothetical protein AB5I41_18595 [Sphingomonas sp. MMS24-JH45]